MQELPVGGAEVPAGGWEPDPTLRVGTRSQRGQGLNVLPVAEEGGVGGKWAGADFAAEEGG